MNCAQSPQSDLLSSVIAPKAMFNMHRTDVSKICVSGDPSDK